MATCSQDSVDPPVADLLAPTAAVMPSKPYLVNTSSMDLPALDQEVLLSLPPDASSAAASPISPGSPQPSRCPGAL